MMAKSNQSTEGEIQTVENSENDQYQRQLLYDDPHIAAIEYNPVEPEKLSWSTLLAIGFLGLSPVAPISCGFLLITSVLVNIGEDFNDLGKIGWIVSGWSIASSVAFTLAGSLSDIFGRRQIILLGQAISVIGAIVGGTAQSISAVIAGSTLLGFACGLVLILYAAIPELVPFKYRGLGLAWSEFCLYIPWGTLAVLLAKLFVQHASWRWCYYIAIIYGAISFIGTSLLYFPPSRPQHDESDSRWQQFLKLDWIALTLYTGGLSVFLLGLSWGGTAGHPWASASVITPIVLGFLVFCCTFAYDWTIGNIGHVFFPWHLFSRFREYTVLLIVVLVAGMIFYTMSAFLSEATAYIFTSDNVEIGITLLPNGFGQLVGSVLLPSLLHITKNPKWHIVTAVTIQTLFVGLYAYGVIGHKAAWMAFQFFGQGCFPWITVCTIVNAGLHVRQSELGLAIGVIGTFRSLGGSVGNAIFGSILSQTFDNHLGPRITAAALKNGFNPEDLSLLIPAVLANAQGVPAAFASVPGITAAIEAATMEAYRDTWAYAFQIVFYSTIPFGVVALIAALLIKDSTSQMTNHTSVRMEKNVLGKRPRDEKEVAV